MKRDPNDQTELKITLSQAQCDALADEAKARGVKFFDHCRAKLLANMSVLMDLPFKVVDNAPAMRTELPQAKLSQPTTAQPDRIDRLEAMMMQMAETLHTLANPPYIAEAQEPNGTQADFDTIMQSRLAEAESKGLTAPRAAAEPAYEDDSDYRMIGVRRFNRPAPPNFSSLGSSGRIQREGTPTAGA